MTLENWLKDIAGYAEMPESESAADVAPLCDRCHEEKPVIKLGRCADCIEIIDRGYVISKKLGRLANGAERDKGKIWHARLLDESHRAEHTAICGTSPGKRSVGWSYYDDSNGNITCARCANTLKRMGR